MKQVSYYRKYRRGVLLCLFLLCPPGIAPGVGARPVKPGKGLTAAAGGTLHLNGKPYRGIGVNYFSAFSRTLRPESWQDTSYRAGFRYLRARKIPFIRFTGGGFWPADWNLYQHNKTQYFRNLDAFVKAAEQFGIGLIPSLFWHYSTIPDLVGEPVGQWGNPDSKTIRFMKTYVSEVVKRYRDSPAIWGWEFGNEYNLVADLPGENSHLPPVTVENGTPAVRTGADKLHTAAIATAMTEFAKAVRLYDNTRILISGNAHPRPAAYHLMTEKNWSADTREEYGKVLALQNPDGINTISVHHYPENEMQHFREGKVGLGDLLKEAMLHAGKLKKPLFVGEFGAPERKLGADVAKEKYKELLEGIDVSGAPLAAVWVFDYPPHNTEEGINIGPDNGPREYMLEMIKELNEKWN